MAVRVSEIDYYSLHGIWGAYASFALGRVDRGAGVAVGDVQPPDRGLFVGYKAGSGEPRLLPFVSKQYKPTGASAYEADQDNKSDDIGRTRCYSYFRPEEMEREVSFSGEEWRAGAMSFRVISFFGEVPDPRHMPSSSARSAYRPAILLQLTFDNSTQQSPMTGLFGMQGIRRPFSDSTNGDLLGMACNDGFGFAIRSDSGIEEVMDWSVVDAAFNGSRPLRRLAREGGIRFSVAPGKRAQYVIALGVFREGIVTTGRPARAYYTCLFKDIEDVLENALDEQVESLFRAERLDSFLDNSGLSEDRRFIVAQASHSYVANTELLLSQAGEPVFLVNEGEYQMMNTLDLTIDQAFWESQFSPWTLRNELDLFWEYSSYRDLFGAAFAHDQGVGDCFSPKGCSVYELPGLTDCFSYMSYEETLNWLITACLYVNLTGDWNWAKERRKILATCLQSIRARDGNNDGIMDRDSDRCAGGAEITTYDSLDPSLGQARNNLYLAVKSWSAFVCLGSLFRKIDRAESPDSLEADRAAVLVANTLVQKAQEENGFIPAIFENNNQSYIIPAVEGLIYPFFCGAPDAVKPDGPYGSLIRVLKAYLCAALVPGRCIDTASGAWKISSTSRNTWLSKVFLNQFVAESLLAVKDNGVMDDHVYAQWLRTGSADYSATDQVDASCGEALGSRFYPRLVTSVLWLWAKLPCAGTTISG